MKPLYLVMAIICSVSLVSCTDTEEPVSPLIGDWENRVYVDSLDHWFIQSYQFVNDSTYDIIETVRETEGGEDLGYRFITRGWYDLQADDFFYYYSGSLIIDNYFRANINEGEFYAPKEELVEIILDFFREPTANLTFSSDRKQFVFTDECLEYVSECPTAKTFIRVD